MISVDDRREAANILKQVEKKAKKSDLFYVICYWLSPVGLACRVGYFEDVSEVKIFQESLSSFCTERGYSYYITSNTSYKDDGGLFNA